MSDVLDATRVDVGILEFSETRGALAMALAKAQQNFGTIAKTEEGKVDSEKAKYTYKYADLAGVLAGVLPALNAQGLFFTQGAHIRGVVVTIETMLLHESGEWVRNRFSLESKGTDAQKLGSALTYAKRYSALGILGVAPAEDDDGKGASTGDDRDAIIADLQSEFGAYTSVVVAIAKRLVSRAVPAVWQATTAHTISNARTKNWAELTTHEMGTFYRAMGSEFSGAIGDAAPETAEKPAEDVPALVAAQPELEPRLEPVQGDSEADTTEKKRLDYVAWIEPRLAHLTLPESEIQDYVGAIRNRTLDADPSADLSITYDWRELRERELRDFYAMLPKKARATAGAA